MPLISAVGRQRQADLLSSSPAWSIECILEQTGLRRETLSLKTNKQKKGQGDVAQWYHACLAYTGPWAQLLIPYILYEFLWQASRVTDGKKTKFLSLFVT